ncbi:MAG TPA: hypothetical protein VNG04_05790, partial [Candidatus Acidoferrum sp.]|nr:hypothetical protein [Candidatus Acidoferrum sp.]
AVCEVEITVADADDLVRTDAGPVHRECFDGPVPPPATADEVLGMEGISVVNGVICADERSARQLRELVREDLDTPLDPDRRS